MGAERVVIGSEKLLRLEEWRRPFFTPETLAEYLVVSRRTVEYMLAEGEIPSIKIRGRRRILAEDVDRYVAELRRKEG